ncbi:MAG: ABC transporter ATP-binding protein [Anaerolineaceae bacterium]|nr:ABC transporter ATP-binding protein [Anaerolineaceae bacterium]MCY4105446.1 ABC transporter ATP-binding protein [Chloroflexota bacterium]
MTPQSPALVVDSLTVGYGSGPNVIESVNLNLAAGNLCCLLGDNGAGKSTFLKAIAGLIPFRHGSIYVNGLDCRKSHTRVGYLPQDAEVDWRFPATVQDVVMMGRVRDLGWLRYPGREDQQTVERVMCDVCLQELREQPITDLSSGQRRRVLLARTLAQGADLLLWDEPFTGVDLDTRQELCQTLIQLNQAGFAMIVSSHAYDAFALPYESAILLNSGELHFGETEAILALGRERREPVH